ncbi:MAG TPA: nucleoside deaminase [Methanotrichaceae archaeon]|nr:nucleoside deaminase [Methanotrichaceae archaeon]
MRKVLLLIILVFLLASGSQAAAIGLNGSGSEALVQAGYDNSTLDEAEQALNGYTPDPAYPDDPFVIDALKEALAAAREGNYGVGACLVAESNGTTVDRGHNQVFYPYFRSDMHAEMDVLDRYEDRMRSPSSRVDGLTLYLTLEPSPMGLSRILASGVRKVRYVVPDSEGGMLHLMNNMPPVWRELAEGKDYAQAKCSPELKDLASKIFLLSRQRLDERLKAPT